MVDGWSTKTEFRRTGNTAGAYDAYYISPTGKRFRSRPEVASYLQLGPPRSGHKRSRGGNPAIGADGAPPAEGMAEVEAEMEEGAEDGADAGDEEGSEKVEPKRAATAAVRQAEAEGLTLPQRAGKVGRRLRER